jgi:hypothetical protein
MIIRAIITHSTHQNACFCIQQTLQTTNLGGCSSPNAPKFRPCGGVRWQELGFKLGAVPHVVLHNILRQMRPQRVVSQHVFSAAIHGPFSPREGINLMWLRPLAGWLLSSTAGHLHGPWRQWNEPQKNWMPQSLHWMTLLTFWSGMSVSPPLLTQIKN